MKILYKFVCFFIGTWLCSTSWANTPEHLLGQWQVDINATQKVINQSIKNTQSTQKLKQDLLELAGEISVLIRPDAVLIKGKSGVINLLSIFSEQYENNYLFEYQDNNNTQTLTIELLDNELAKISAPFLFGLEWYRWKKQQENKR